MDHIRNVHPGVIISTRTAFSLSQSTFTYGFWCVAVKALCVMILNTYVFFFKRRTSLLITLPSTLYLNRVPQQKTSNALLLCITQITSV
jgi:hypothetical protein